LGIWLIATGLVDLGGVRFSGSATILPVLAVVSGFLFLLADRSEKLWARMGTILPGIWLVATGLVPLLHIRFSGSGVVLALLAIAAGVVMLIRR
jgi:hypothetical protein